MDATAPRCPPMHISTDRIDALLPQTQCTKCGYAGCRPYAEALAGGTAAINRCPPGGAAGIDALAALLSRPALPLDPACGVERAPRVARIDPDACIGCTKCIAACPVDAIIGAAKRMHTVIAAHCTGCDLCLPVCPVDCIALVASPGRAQWSAADAAAARERHGRRRVRLERARGGVAPDRTPPADRTAPANRTAAADPAAPANRTVAADPGTSRRAVGDACPGSPSPDGDAGRPAAGIATTVDDAARARRAMIESAMQRARERLAQAPRRGGSAPR